ncbi:MULTISPECIES: hypothetical protein [Micromonospora]|uniref:hypothetical protein n=1 Tax=Micromonospora TaxID=1873 RepID=UPI001EE919F2|nr:hypothetical protein [Micromonospora hortensis]MCG5452021.1 hypothetical protein [Micromonospora hortensis]WTI10274.1 hypothetical protein OHB44_11605 [Micromonospora sp. NBC_00821]
MLPVAFTCPLWWVARWATRVLTSLAVVAALALGAGPATAVTPTPGPVPTSSAVPASAAAGSLAASSRHSWASSAARPAAATPPEAAEESAPTWSVHTPVALFGDQGTMAAVVLPVGAAESDRLPLVDGTGGRASRAPPAR